MAPRFTAITFIHPFGSYQVGETASFPTARAEAMIKGKVAKAYSEPAKKQPKTVKPVEQNESDVF